MTQLGRKWKKRIRRWRGDWPVHEELSVYEAALSQIDELGERLQQVDEGVLKQLAAGALQAARAQESSLPDKAEYFALVREVAHRKVNMRPYDVQLIAGWALEEGQLIEMKTGEGKTLAAVAPAAYAALTGQGVHILTFNDYLARRDAAWMGPLYDFLGLSVGVIQEGMSIEERKQAYQADITYATAKEAGFDFLRMQLVRDPSDQVHRPFNLAIIDEADSILIDEARVPLVIAGQREGSGTDPYRLARLIDQLEETTHWETDENDRNAFLTNKGLALLEEKLQTSSLHDEANYLLLTEVNQALHARTLLHRDVDYIVRQNRIEIVDEFTGRVVDDRRWPDGLQAALEAKEGLAIQPGGQILGSISLQHFLGLYPKLAGMTATAQPAAEELHDFYGLTIVPIPPNKPSSRDDLPDVVYATNQARQKGLIEAIRRAHRVKRPVLVGTSSVADSEELAAQLRREAISCHVLNARNDEEEAGIIAEAGAPGAVTISTNMAGRGTDIRLGGQAEHKRGQVVKRGGLLVLGTTRHESRRIDDQLRGRAGRQGDPGASQFFISLEDAGMKRFGIDELIPAAFRDTTSKAPLEHRVIHREVDRVQRIVEGQNYEIRKTLLRYSNLVEKQRAIVQEWREAVLTGASSSICEDSKRYKSLVATVGAAVVQEAERVITLHALDRNWEEHLAFISEVREGIHLVGIGGLDPLNEFHKQLAEVFESLKADVGEDVLALFDSAKITPDGLDEAASGLKAPASTWTYLVSDRATTELHNMLFGPANVGMAVGGALILWPVLFLWGIQERRKRRREKLLS